MGKIIVIDPGHGGNDPGAIGNNLKEKEVTLKLAKATRDYLENHYTGMKVILTRETDITLSLNQRSDLADKENADILASIHINSAGSSAATGFESYIYNGIVNQGTTALQNAIHTEVAKVNDLEDRGQKKANFHMVREPRCSAVLTENGFIVNKSDSNKMKSPEWIKKVGQAHAVGMAEFLGLQRAEQPKQEEAGALYRVQLGAFSNLENAKSLEEKAKKAGFNVYIYKD
jgi:N-acetylmuramoyl-L-alanine amidase